MLGKTDHESAARQARKRFERIPGKCAETLDCLVMAYSARQGLALNLDAREQALKLAPQSKPQPRDRSFEMDEWPMTADNSSERHKAIFHLGEWLVLVRRKRGAPKSFVAIESPPQRQRCAGSQDRGVSCCLSFRVS